MKASAILTGALSNSFVGMTLVIVSCGVGVIQAQQVNSFSQPKAVPTKVAREVISSPGYYEVKTGADRSAQEESLAIAPALQWPQVQNSGSSSSKDKQGRSIKPVGTAAAPSETTMGVTASRPAGAVIAPAKQRRVRSILIRVGLIVGAGVALGTVMALSHATPSRPQ